MNMKRILIYLCILLTGIGWSCSDWLDVKPSDRISEENAFSSIAGFKNALNGIYVELNQDNLYGRRLTVDFVEILAKRYYVHEENQWAYDLMNYEYGGSSVKGYLSGIWGAAYKLIVMYCLMTITEFARVKHWLCVRCCILICSDCSALYIVSIPLPFLFLITKSFHWKLLHR